MNRRSFISKLVGCVVAASLVIRLEPAKEIPSKWLDAASDCWSTNTRRKIFYNYPKGQAPLSGLITQKISFESTESLSWFERN